MNTMVSQIQSLPDLLRETFQNLDESARMKLHPELILSLKQLFITGCGDSHHVGITTQLAFHQLAGVPTTPTTAMDFARYRAGFVPNTGPNTNLVVGISVSGTVVRTFEALKMAKDAGAVTLSLTASADSLVGKAGEILFEVPNIPFPMPEGEVCPGVRSYFVNQVALLLMALRIGEVRGTITSAEASDYRKNLLGLADIIEETIENNRQPIVQLVEEWKDAGEFVFVGGGPNFGTALFSAAKLLEASGDSALGQYTEEWGHLQYFAKEPSTPTFLITAGDRDLCRMVEVAVAAKTIGRRVAAICPVSADELTKIVDHAFTFTPISEAFSGPVTQIAGELFASYRAEILGEPFFRNFGGGRDIEGGGGISRIRTSEYWETWQE